MSSQFFHNFSYSSFPREVELYISTFSNNFSRSAYSIQSSFLSIDLQASRNVQCFSVTVRLLLRMHLQVELSLDKNRWIFIAQVSLLLTFQFVKNFKNEGLKYSFLHFFVQFTDNIECWCKQQ